MSFKRVYFAAVTAICLIGTETVTLAQNSGAPSGTHGAVPSGAPATVGVGPTPAPTPGQSISILGNTPGTSQGIGPAPAPTPGQSVSTQSPSRPVGSVAPTDSARPVQPPRQGRMHNARVPRELPTTAGSGPARPESPSRPERFVTPNIMNEPGSGEKQSTINTPPLSPQTGRPLPSATER